LWDIEDLLLIAYLDEITLLIPLDDENCSLGLFGLRSALMAISNQALCAPAISSPIQKKA